MHAAYYRPIFGNRILPDSMISNLYYFVQNFSTTLSEINSILVNNKVWKSRLVNLGKLSLKHIEEFGLSGVLARSVGYNTDLRIKNDTPYCLYNSTNINSYLAKNGDCYDRYNLRMFEMLESSNVINNILSSNFNSGTQNTNNTTHYGYMEDTIQKFKL